VQQHTKKKKAQHVAFDGVLVDVAMAKDDKQIRRAIDVAFIVTINTLRTKLEEKIANMCAVFDNINKFKE